MPSPLLHRELELPADVTEFVLTTSDGTTRVYAVPEGVKRLTLMVTSVDADSYHRGWSAATWLP